MIDDIANELIEQEDGTYRVVPRVTPDFSILETNTQEAYIAPDRSIKKTRGRMDLILERLKRGSSITAACTAADIKPSTLRYWRKNDEKFDQACKDAWEEGTAVYEEEAFDRGKNGTVADVYHQGIVVGQKIEHHDPLLLRTLERRAPEDWGRATQRVELTGKDGGPLRVMTLDLSKSEEELAQLGHSYLTEEYRAALEKPQEK